MANVRKPMRILAAADLHGIATVYQWVVGLARTSAADLLVLAGDLLPSDFAEEQRKHAPAVRDCLRSAGIPVLYIMGNDDNAPLDADDGLLVPIHGRPVEAGGYQFLGYQYTPPSFIGDMFVKPDEEIAADLVLFEPMLDARTVFITHTPAWGHLDMSFGENVGSRAVAALLRRRPVLAHIHGHIHQQFGRSGNHFNVACAGLCRAMLIDLPSLRHAVVDGSVRNL